jgi:hypothetical protein
MRRGQSTAAINQRLCAINRANVLKTKITEMFTRALACRWQNAGQITQKSWCTIKNAGAARSRTPKYWLYSTTDSALKKGSRRFQFAEIVKSSKPRSKPS